MATDPTTVASNIGTPRLDAAIRRRADLYEAILAVEKAAARPATGRERDWIETCLDALQCLHPEIVEHIECTESPDGLYAEVAELAPRLVHRIELLREEHVEMRTMLETIMGEFASRPETQETVEYARSATQQLLGLLVRHRQRGSDLIWETYNLDIGTTD